MKLKTALSLFFIVLLLLGNFPSSTKAAISSCSVSISPGSVSPDEVFDLEVNVTNGGSADAVWIKLSRPSGNFTIRANSSPGWSAGISDSEMTLTSGTLTPGSSYTFYAVVGTGSTEASSANWSIAVSDDASGAGATNCSGSTGTAITTGAAAVSNISGLSVSDVTTSSVKVSWTTNQGTTSIVDYGTTGSLGSTKQDTSLVTGHTITLDGLTSNTTYHYTVTSVDASGNRLEANGNTFTTAKEGSASSSQSSATTTSSSSTSTSTSTSSSPTPKPAATPVPDTQAPVVSFSPDLSKPHKTAPKMTGKVSDNKGVTKVEYSVDDGQNWLLVERVKGEGGSVNFEFTPTVSEDGNYKIRVRAKDAAGNIGSSKTVTLVIDQMPPRIGGHLVSVGPQILLPTSKGTIVALSGLDQKITLSAIGGPTEIDLLTNDTATLGVSPLKVFSLVKNPDNGLWSGTLSFQSPGTYPLKARAVDGAGNITEQVMAEVQVVEAGQIKNTTQPIADARVSVLYFESQSGTYQLWDAKSYAQVNPQTTDSNGHYRLFLPPGKYYLAVSAPGYKPLISDIFSVDQPTPINSKLTLEHKRQWNIGPLRFDWLDFGHTTASVIPAPARIDTRSVSGREAGIQKNGSPSGSGMTVSQQLPSFKLSSAQGAVTDLALRGKPTIITLLNSWSPQSAAQIQQLEAIDRSAINLLAVLPQESTSSSQIYKQRGSYKLPIVADPLGELAQNLNYGSIPTHYFVDRRGLIKAIKVGVLTSDELLNNLVH